MILNPTDYPDSNIWEAGLAQTLPQNIDSRKLPTIYYCKSYSFHARTRLRSRRTAPTVSLRSQQKPASAMAPLLPVAQNIQDVALSKIAPDLGKPKPHAPAIAVASLQPVAQNAQDLALPQIDLAKPMPIQAITAPNKSSQSPVSAVVKNVLAEDKAQAQTHPIPTASFRVSRSNKGCCARFLSFLKRIFCCFRRK